MVPDRNHRGHAVYGLALIGLGVLTHYAWSWFPAEHQSQIWNITGAFARLVGVCLAAWFIRSTVARLAAFWWACEELLVIGCSTLYMIRPWDVPEGQAQCSALLQFDLGRVGMALAVFVLWRHVSSYRCESHAGDR